MKDHNSYLPLHNKLCQNFVIENTIIHYLRVSLCQKSRCDQLGATTTRSIESQSNDPCYHLQERSLTACRTGSCLKISAIRGSHSRMSTYSMCSDHQEGQNSHRHCRECLTTQRRDRRARSASIVGLLSSMARQPFLKPKAGQLRAHTFQSCR